MPLSLTARWVHGYRELVGCMFVGLVAWALDGLMHVLEDHGWGFSISLWLTELLEPEPIPFLMRLLILVSSIAVGYVLVTLRKREEMKRTAFGRTVSIDSATDWFDPRRNSGLQTDPATTGPRGSSIIDRGLLGLRGVAKAVVTSIGPKNSWEYIRHVRWKLWDIWHHVDTSRAADFGSLNVLGGNRAHAVPYEPSGSALKALKDLPINYEQYGFVDFGAGKGRVLLLASGFPFKFVEGVEFSIELHTIAENNIRQFRRAKVRCRQVRSVLADATEYSLPATPLVLYFFNPFAGPVLSSVTDNIRQSMAANPRDIVVLCTGRWMRREAFECIPNVEVLWRGEYSAAYRLPRGRWQEN